MEFSIAIGVLSGVVSSLFAWWVLHHVMVPDLQLSLKIKKSRSDISRTGYFYQVKIGNLNYRSNVIDIKVNAFLYMKDQVRTGVTNIIPIPLDPSYLYELSTRSKGGGAWARRITLRQNDDNFCSQITGPFFTEEMKQFASESALTIEDLLQITDRTCIRVYVFATDSFSGSRKVLKSKDYYRHDIEYGEFIRTSLYVKPMNELSQPKSLVEPDTEVQRDDV